MTRGPHSALARRLRSVRAPEEAQSEERTWGVVRRVFAERPATRRGRRLRPRLALAPVGALLVGVLALTPAGAAVHSWIDRTLGVRHARTALFSLPAPGRILVSGDSGTWTVATDGVRRRLGPWPVATWSPHGEYVAVASPDELTAVDTKGTLRWSIPRRAVALPRWFAPDGYRVAYLSGTTLRVIAGDGTGDHLLARQVAQGVAPASYGRARAPARRSSSGTPTRGRSRGRISLQAESRSCRGPPTGPGCSR